MTTKESVFFALIFVLFYVFVNVKDRIQGTPDVQQLVAGLGFTLTLILISSILKFKMASDTKDDFFFEVTPEKLCDGGPYMYSSNPEKAKYCSTLTPQQYSAFNCPCGMYHGRPVHYEYTPMSNDKWENGYDCQNVGKSDLKISVL